MRVLAVAVISCLVGGCAGLSQPQLTGLENIATGLLCAQTGVCLTVGAPNTCSTPPLPDALLVPCPAPDANKSAQDNAAAQLQCSVTNAALRAVIEYSKSICPPPVVPKSATAVTSQQRGIIYLQR